jgi:hypothetical protein
MVCTRQRSPAANRRNRLWGCAVPAAYWGRIALAVLFLLLAAVAMLVFSDRAARR